MRNFLIGICVVLIMTLSIITQTGEAQNVYPQPAQGLESKFFGTGAGQYKTTIWAPTRPLRPVFIVITTGADTTDTFTFSFGPGGTIIFEEPDEAENDSGMIFLPFYHLPPMTSFYISRTSVDNTVTVWGYYW